MRKVSLFIAMSLDGKIAKLDQSVDWLEDFDHVDPDPRYETFYETIDTVVMGSTTYLQLVNELFPEYYFYRDKKSIIFTSKDIPLKEGVSLVNRPVVDVILEEREKPGSGIWIVGGTKVAMPLIEANLIDEYIVTIIPIILGEGIDLFESFPIAHKLKTEEVTSINGLVSITYSAIKA